MERKERKSPASDTLYEVVSLESETERERRKTTASPGVLTSGAGPMVPSPPEDDEEEGDYTHHTLHCWRCLLTSGQIAVEGWYQNIEPPYLERIKPHWVVLNSS